MTDEENLPYVISPAEPSSLPKGEAHGCLSEKMKYNKMSSSIEKNFNGRYVLVSETDLIEEKPNYIIGEISKIDPKLGITTISFGDNNIEIHKKNPSRRVLLIEYCFSMKKGNSLAFILSDFNTKEAMITKPNKDGLLYTAVVIKLSSSTKKLGKFPSGAVSTVSSALLSNVAFSNTKSSLSQLAVKVNSVYEKFLFSVEYTAVSPSSLHKYLLHEIVINKKISILLSYNKTYDSYMILKDTSAEWTNLQKDKKILVCSIKGPLLISSLLQNRKAFTFKNTKMLSIYDDLKYETNILLSKSINGLSVFSLVECSKCMYSIGNFDCYVCYSCAKVFHKKCVGDDIVKTLINGAFSCEECRPCCNCKSNTGKVLICNKCHNGFHLKCIHPKIRTVYSESESMHFICESCASCSQCLSNVYAIAAKNAKLNLSCSMCTTCEEKRNKKEFCVVCDQLWFTNSTVIECKSCKFYYHKECDRLYIENSDKKFIYCCPKCRMKKKRKYLENLTNLMINKDDGQCFIDPVDVKAIPNYTKVIKHPMCFKFILSKTETNEYLEDIELFFNNVLLIFGNAMIFNKPNDFIYHEAEKVKVLCEEILNSHRNSLYELCFEFYLFDYFDSEEISNAIKEKIKVNQTLNVKEFIINSVHQKLKEKFSSILKTGKISFGHTKLRCKEFGINYPFLLEEFNINVNEADIENNDIADDVDMEIISPAVEKKHKPYKSSSELLIELDLLNSNFEVPRKSNRTVNTNKMELSDSLTLLIKENDSLVEEDEFIQDFENLKLIDKKISFLYPNKFKDYCTKKNDKQEYIDFITSFINKKDKKSSKTSKKANSSQTKKVNYTADDSDESEYSDNEKKKRTSGKKIGQFKKESKKKLLKSQSSLGQKKKTSNDSLGHSTDMQVDEETPTPRKHKNSFHSNASPRHVSRGQTFSVYQICSNDFSLAVSKNCYLCGSFDEIESMISCKDCANTYHYYCVSPDINIDVAKSTPWECPKCKKCFACKGKPEEKQKLISCTVCDKSFHNFCLPYPFYTQCKFKCNLCFKCDECGSKEYYHASFVLKKEKDYTFFTRNFTYCYECGLKLFFNSLCVKCETSDFKNYRYKLVFIKEKKDLSKLEGQKQSLGQPESKIMLYCDCCKKWYHSNCIGFDELELRDYFSKYETFICLDCSLLNSYGEKASDVSYITYLEVLRTSFKLMCLSKIMMILLKQYQVNSAVKLHTKLIKMFLKEKYETLSKNKNITLIIELMKIDVFLLKEKTPFVPQSQEIDLIQNDMDEELILAEGAKDIKAKGPIYMKHFLKTKRKFEERNDRSRKPKATNILFDPMKHKRHFKNFSFDKAVLGNVKDINLFISKINFSKLKAIPSEPKKNDKLKCKAYDERFIKTHFLQTYMKKDDFIEYQNNLLFPKSIVDLYKFDLNNYFTFDSPENIIDKIKIIILSLNKSSLKSPFYTSSLIKFTTTLVYNCIIYLRVTLVNWLLSQLANIDTLSLGMNELTDDITDEALTKYLDEIDPITSSANDSNIKCEFCLRMNSRSKSGRLIYLNLANKWGHVNCIYWSKGIVHSNGLLSHVNSILNKLPQFKCLICKKNGATVVCHVPKCARSFHFICALAKSCTFTSSHVMYCNRCTHTQKDDTDIVLMNSTKRLYQVDRKGDKYHIGVYNKYGNVCVLKLAVVSEKDFIPENLDMSFIKVYDDKSIIITIQSNTIAINPINKGSSYELEVEKYITENSLNNCFVKTELDEIKMRFPNVKIYEAKSDEEKVKQFSEFLVKTLELEDKTLSLKAFLNFPYDLDKILNTDSVENSLIYLNSIIGKYQSDSLISFNSASRSRLFASDMSLNKKSNDALLADSSRNKRSSTNSKLEAFIVAMRTKNKIYSKDCFKFVNYIESHREFITKKRTVVIDSNSGNDAGKKKKSQYKNLPSSSQLLEYNIPLSKKYRDYKSQGMRVAIGPSRIHRNGLFAMDNFKQGEIVIEYVGEIITNKIADFREKEYNLRGFGDCYMFRIDADKIIDATKYGNLARFINHCCDPNCSAQSNEINGRKHIILYAKRDININEEITYDYNFESETEKIQCRCGAANCQGRLN